MLIGYARVSTVDQETDLQRDALKAAGVKVLYEEKASGVGDRPELRRALRSMRGGDVLVVWKMDRVARSLSDLLQVLRDLKTLGCQFRSLTEPIDTTTPIGEFILQVLGAVAQLERSMIRERAIAGQVAYLMRGGKFGRPRVLKPVLETEIKNRLKAGQSQRSIASDYGVSRSVVRRVKAQRVDKVQSGGMPVLAKYLGRK